jgi:hypothetical protein
MNPGKPRNSRLLANSLSGHVPNTADLLTVIAEQMGGHLVCVNGWAES